MAGDGTPERKPKKVADNLPDKERKTWKAGKRRYARAELEPKWLRET